MAERHIVDVSTACGTTENIMLKRTNTSHDFWQLIQI